MFELLKPVMGTPDRFKPGCGYSKNMIVGYRFLCPGCSRKHVVWTCHHITDMSWSFTGTLENPSFSPSMVLEYGPDDVCHMVIKNGMIDFCTDSTHSLAGKTVPMAPII